LGSASRHWRRGDGEPALLLDLFGAAAGEHGQQGLIGFDDSVSHPLPGSDTPPAPENGDALGPRHTADLVEASDVELEKWLNADIATHVGLGRWTGGAADHLLFTVAEPWGIDWHPIVIEVDVGHPRFRPAMLHLVLRTLLAAEEGRVPLGGSVTRGLGTIGIDRIEVQGFDTDLITDTTVTSVRDLAEPLAHCTEDFVKWIEHASVDLEPGAPASRDDDEGRPRDAA
jgi:hypothetical protein